MMERYKSAISSLQVRVVSEAQMAPFYKKVDSLPADRLCLQFIKEEGYFVVSCLLKFCKGNRRLSLLIQAWSCP